MNTLQTIYNKLEDKTELAKHEVELTAVDEVRKFIENTTKRKEEFKKFAQITSQQLDNLKVSANMWNNDYSAAAKIMEQLSLKAKEIGLELPKEFLDYKKQFNDGIIKTKNYAEIINKIKAQIPQV